MGVERGWLVDEDNQLTQYRLSCVWCLTAMRDKRRIDFGVDHVCTCKQCLVCGLEIALTRASESKKGKLRQKEGERQTDERDRGGGGGALYHIMGKCHRRYRKLLLDHANYGISKQT